MNSTDKPAGKLPDYIRKHFHGHTVTDSRSPAGNWLQFTLEHVERGKAVITLNVRPEMTNPYRHIHGGMMSLVIDEAIGWAVVSLDTDNHYTTLNLNVDFLYAIREGERLRAVAEVVRSGKKIIHVECRVYNMEELLLAKATSNLVVTGMRPAEGDAKIAY
jgi:acyl-coenzyme A thioesterase 13